jgi:cytoskeletal protein CcmA (bactofilin family)
MAWTGQKPEPEPIRPIPPAPTPAAPGTATFPQAEQKPRTDLAGTATIGKSLQIKGELTGNENLMVEGSVEGKIILHGHDVTIGPDGRVKAEVHARSVSVGGNLTGNVNADDRVRLTGTGKMTGDIRAPRVVLEDGAHFKGAIDMDAKGAPKS